MMAMLVELAYKKQGIVDECSIVVASTERYRESQDYLAEFAKEHIAGEQGGKIKKTELYNTFKEWYTYILCGSLLGTVHIVRSRTHRGD